MAAPTSHCGRGSGRAGRAPPRAALNHPRAGRRRLPSRPTLPGVGAPAARRLWLHPAGRPLARAGPGLPAHGPLKPRIRKVVFFIHRGKRRRVDRPAAGQDADPRDLQTRQQAPQPRAHLLPPQGLEADRPQDGVQAPQHVQVARRAPASLLARMKRVLVTGGAGALAAAVVRRLPRSPRSTSRSASCPGGRSRWRCARAWRTTERLSAPEVAA